MAVDEHVMTVDANSSTLFEGLTFVVPEDFLSRLQGLNILHIIETCGGKLVEFRSQQRNAGTHVLARNRKHSCCVWGQQEGKALVTAFWVFESYEEGRLLPIDDPLYVPFPSDGIPGAAGCRVTLTGFQGPIRGQLLELLACTGVEVMRQMNPMTVTHVVTSDVNENTEKVNRARMYQPRRPGEIAIVNCLWIYNSLRFWKLQAPEGYLGNPDPEANPARGQPAFKSLPAHMAEVPNSEDEDCIMQTEAIPARERQDAAPPGPLPALQNHRATPGAPAGTSAQPLGSEAAAPSSGPPQSAPSGQHRGHGSRGSAGSGWRSRNQAEQAQTTTPATAVEHSSGAKENRAPMKATAGEWMGNRGSKAGTKDNTDARGTDGATQIFASESQVPECQVAAAQAMTGLLINQLASGLPSSDPHEQPDHVSLLYNAGRRQKCRNRVSAAATPGLADDRQAGTEVDDDPMPAEGPNEQSEPSPAPASLQAQQCATSKCSRQPDSLFAEPAPAAAQDAEPEAQLSKKRKLLSKAATAALGRGPKTPATGNAKATKSSAPKAKAERKAVSQARPKTKAAAEPAEPARQDQEQAGAAAGRNGATPNTAQRRELQKRSFVALSGLHTKEIRQFSPLLEGLGVSHTDGLEDDHVWNYRTTHWVAPRLSRTAKALSAMAAGAWLLSTSFITASAAARALVEPEEHELATGCPLVAEGAPQHWRLRAQSLGHGAFHSLRVLVHGTFKADVKPNRKDITSILTAGGATLLSLQEAVLQGADLAIMPPSTAKNQIKELVKAGITCASPQYIVEWIAHPEDRLAKHVLHGMRESARLAEMAKERCKCPAAEEQSCSF